MPSDSECSGGAPEKNSAETPTQTEPVPDDGGDEHNTPPSPIPVAAAMADNLGGSSDTGTSSGRDDPGKAHSDKDTTDKVLPDITPVPSSLLMKESAEDDGPTAAEQENPEAATTAAINHADENINQAAEQLTQTDTLAEEIPSELTLTEEPHQQSSDLLTEKPRDWPQEQAEDDDSATSAPKLKDPIIAYYRHKNILLTGATGFVGKAILWKLIKSLGNDIGKVYLLIREGGDHKRSSKNGGFDRVKNEILNNKGFVELRRQMTPDVFDTIVKEKLVRVTGDIISPDLSLNDEDRAAITSNVHIIIHCAATRDYQERLDLSLETNTLGTLRLMDLADLCEHMTAFVHMSLAYREQTLPDGHVQERVYPMEIGDPESILNDLVNTELDGLLQKTESILRYYPNTHTFTKTLTEHLILKRVDNNRIEEAQGYGEKGQWPVSIVRASLVGAGAFEPLAGWVDGVTGFNNTVFLTGQGMQMLPHNVGDMLADIVPVDYLARVVIGCPVVMKKPGQRFLLPYNEILSEPISNLDPASDSALRDILYFPFIYQVTACGLENQTRWRDIYDAMRGYWTKTTNASLPTTNNYFTSNKAVHKAKMLIKSLRSSMTAAIQGNTEGALRTVNTNVTNPVTVNLALHAAQSNQPFLQRPWVLEHANVHRMQALLKTDPSFDPTRFYTLDWRRYMMNYSFGAHAYIMQAPPGLRNDVPTGPWDCALYSRHERVNREIKSVIFSESDIQKRTERMLSVVIASLEKPETEAHDKEEWINDFDASLDDWCHDDSTVLSNTNDIIILGYWPTKSIGGLERVVERVFQDRRVMSHVRQVAKNSGVPETIALGEVEKFLKRMYERTQLPYVLYAGAFLDSLLKRLFGSIRLQEADVQRIKSQIKGKKVVYITTSKTLLDPLLVWYLCLCYNWPVPAIACDEALALLGPISDILRITGTFFVRRSDDSRSPMNTSVAAAYVESMLREHGAISLSLERARSRTGRLQKACHDGILGMVLEAATQSTPTESAVDAVLVPIHINYEKIPELQTLIDQVLDQKPIKRAATRPISGGLARSASFLRPSASQALRTGNKESNLSGKYGRVYVGLGPVLDAKEAAQAAAVACSQEEGADKTLLMDNRVARQIQKSQCQAGMVSPVGLVAAVVLSSRSTEGISMGQLYEHVEWLREEIQKKQITLDWQEDEDVSTVVTYAMDLLDAKRNMSIIRVDRRRTDKDQVRCNEHADNIMALSWMANQLTDVLLPEACLSVVCLASESSLSCEAMRERFHFLATLFKNEFVHACELEETFSTVLDRFMEDGFVTYDEENKSYTSVTMPSDQERYDRMGVLASLVYPTLDAYWITMCSLSALSDIAFMPRKVVPLLTQWIASFMISGKQTMYREVLSMEASQSAVDNLLALGFLTAVDANTGLSPDAQILLLELDGAKNEELIMLTLPSTLKDAPITLSDDKMQTTSLKDVASLCDAIEKYRAGRTNRRPAGHLQVFKQCQNEIRRIMSADKSYATLRELQLAKGEDQMIQLIYALKSTSTQQRRATPSS